MSIIFRFQILKHRLSKRNIVVARFHLLLTVDRRNPGTTWDVKNPVNNEDKLPMNWLAGFLNHQQYVTPFWK